MQPLLPRAVLSRPPAVRLGWAGIVRQGQTPLGLKLGSKPGVAIAPPWPRRWWQAVGVAAIATLLAPLGSGAQPIPSTLSESARLALQCLTRYGGETNNRALTACLSQASRSRTTTTTAGATATTARATTATIAAPRPPSATAAATTVTTTTTTTAIPVSAETGITPQNGLPPRPPAPLGTTSTSASPENRRAIEIGGNPGDRPSSGAVSVNFGPSPAQRADQIAQAERQAAGTSNARPGTPPASSSTGSSTGRPAIAVSLVSARPALPISRMPASSYRPADRIRATLACMANNIGNDAVTNCGAYRPSITPATTTTPSSGGPARPRVASVDPGSGQFSGGPVALAGGSSGSSLGGSASGGNSGGNASGGASGSVAGSASPAANSSGGNVASGAANAAAASGAASPAAATAAANSASPGEVASGASGADLVALAPNARENRVADRPATESDPAAAASTAATTTPNTNVPRTGEALAAVVGPALNCRRVRVRVGGIAAGDIHSSTDALMRGRTGPSQPRFDRSGNPITPGRDNYDWRGRPTEEFVEQCDVNPVCEQFGSVNLCQAYLDQEALDRAARSVVVAQPVAFTCGEPESTLQSRGVPRVSYGNTSIYIGYQELTGRNQDPRLARFDNGQQTWCRSDYATTSDDSAGYGLIWNGQNKLYAVFNSASDQGQPSQDFRRFATGGWLSAYGNGRGPLVAVLAQVDPSTGNIGTASYLSSLQVNGASNALRVTALALLNGGLQVVSLADFSPRRPDRSAFSCRNGVGGFNYTTQFSADLSTVTAASAPGCN